MSGQSGHHGATDDRLYQMSHSAKIVSAIFYKHARAAILAVSVIHAMKRDHDAVNSKRIGTITWPPSLKPLMMAANRHNIFFLFEH
jgi:hypothetical protein